MNHSFFKKIKRKFILKTLKDALIIALIGLNTVFGFPIDLIVKTMSEHLGGRLPSPVATAHATSDTYDFSDCGSTCDTDTGWWASADDVDVYPFAGTAANRNTHTELVDANFTALGTSDDSRYAAASPGAGDQLFMWFEMTVTPAADSIQQLTFTFEGHPNTTTTNFSIWLKNDSGAYETNSSWTQVVAATSITADTDATITGSVTTNIEDYIDSNGKVIWAVYEAASAITIDVDYVKMDVTYEPLEQEGFRFRNDDGSETTATWLDAQDANITQPNQTNTRLRMLVNSSGGDPTSNQYQLEYKLSSDSRYQIAEDPTISTTTPTVQSRSTGASSAADTASHTITMPSGITAGDLLLLVFSSDGARDARIDSGDWVKLDEGVNSTIVTGAVFYKFAAGSDTATVTTSAAEQSSHVVLRISGAGVPLSASANGSSTNSDPPSLDTNVSENYLWIATRSGDSTTVATAAPSGFSNLQSQAAAGTSGASTNTAELAATASSQDPGTFTSNTEQWVSFTIAVPASGMGIKSVGAPAAGTTTVHIPYPSNDISTGDLLILPLVNKFPTNAPSTPAGWTAPSNNQASGGSGANASDTGSVYTTVFTRIADGTESGYVSVAVTSGDVTLGRILVVKKEPGKVWNVALVNGSDSSAGTAWSVTGGSDPGITAGDLVLVASGINTDANTYSDHAVSAASVTFLSGGEGEVFESGTNVGNDVKLNMSVAQALSGTSSAAPVFTMTASGSLTDAPAGSSVFIRVRQDTAPIQLVASSNISAGGSATTFQLTAPSGKSTSDFLAGRIQDDENPADAVDLSSSQYTELEWSLTATSVTSNGEIYQFRVTVFGAPFDTYSLTPQWTIGTAGTADIQQVHTRWRNDDGGEGTAGATWAEAEDTLLADVAVGTTYRLRLELSNEGSADSSSLTYQIQVAETGTCSSGTYAAIPTDSSGDWQITASTHFTDGDATTNVASGLTDANTTFVAGQIKDTGNTTSGITLTTTEFTEVEYSIAATSNATAGGNYCFRVSNADTYTVYAQATIVASASTLTLSSYRWYVDSDNESVTDPWGNPNIAEDTILALVPATNVAPVNRDELRLRVAITIGTANLSASSLQLKLQYKAGTDATCTTGSWTDVGVAGEGEVWRYATSSVSDGTTLTASTLTVSDVLGAYAISNPTVSNPNGANIGQDLEYDFHIQHNGASDASTYSFKVVKSDGTVLDTYTNCPTLVTAQSTDQEMRGGNVFVDEVEQGFTRAD